MACLLGLIHNPVIKIFLSLRELCRAQVVPSNTHYGKITIKRKNKSCHSCIKEKKKNNTSWIWIIVLPIIIKICPSIRGFWCYRQNRAPKNTCRGDNNNRMKARFVVFVRNRPCQPNLHSNQILSNIEVMERTRYEGKLHSTRLLLQIYNPTKYYQTISKGTGVMKPTMVYGRTDGRQADRYIPRNHWVWG